MSVRDARGFTLIEVIIAVVIIALVGAGAVHMFSGADRAFSSTKLQSKMYTAGESVGEYLRSDKVWLRKWEKSCSNPLRECPIANATKRDIEMLPALQSPGDGVRFRATVVVAGVDSPTDGLGKENDADSVWPDYYRALITISLDNQSQKDFPNIKPLQYSTIIDPLTIGEDTGSLLVQFCEATNQSDDRVSIATCTDNSKRWIPMEKEPPCDTKVLDYGCNKPLMAARSAGKKYHTVNIEPIPVSKIKFGINGTTSTGKKVSYGKNAAQCNNRNGLCLFTGLPIGSYDIWTSAPPRKEKWKTKIIPVNKSVSVEAKAKSRAMVIWRPPSNHNLVARFSRKVTFYNVVNDSGSSNLGTVTISWTGYKIYTSSKTVPGPAWSMISSIQPKPAGRFTEYDRSSSRYVTKTYQNSICWRQLRDPNPPYEGKSRVKISDLPAGLHSLPGLSPADCSYSGVPKSLRSDVSGQFIWFEGSNDTKTVNYYDPKGECYQSGAAGFRLLREGSTMCTPIVVTGCGSKTIQSSPDHIYCGISVTPNASTTNVTSVSTSTGGSTSCSSACSVTIQSTEDSGGGSDGGGSGGGGSDSGPKISPAMHFSLPPPSSSGGGGGN